MYEITIREDVTLISMHDSPADIGTVADVFTAVLSLAGAVCHSLSLRTNFDGHSCKLSRNDTASSALFNWFALIEATAGFEPALLLILAICLPLHHAAIYKTPFAVKIKSLMQ